MAAYAFRGNEAFVSAVEGRLADAGFERVENVAEAAFVVTFCTSMTALEDLYFGDDALVSTVGGQAVVVDASACTPNLAAEIAAVCAVSDVSMVAAPLVVRNKMAPDAFAHDNLACFAGSEGGGVDDAMPLLEVLYGDVQVVADAGAAQLARAASTIQNTAEMVSAIEALSLFKACSASASSGINVKALVPDATSPEASFIIEAVRDERFKGDYTVEMLMSELSAAIMTGDDYETILPQTEAAFHLFELLAMIGGSDMSPAALSLVYEGEPSDDEGEGAGSRVDAHGLDWSRVEQLCGSDAADGAVEEYGSDSFPFDDGDGDPYDDDNFASGFGYSIN